MNNKITIENIQSGKEDFIDLLLIADPSRELVMKYLSQGELLILRNGSEIICGSIITFDGTTAEIKNISTYPSYQKQGYGKIMMDYIIETYKNKGDIILGTGKTGIPEKEFYQLKFYRECGFVETHVIKNFFIDNYPEPIYEDNGEQCVDMVYLKYKK